MTLAEFLQSQGASAEDIKALTEGSFAGAAKKAFEALQHSAETARIDGEAAKNAAKADRDALTKWFEETATPEFKDMERRAIAAEADAAKARAAWKAAHERGLVDLEQLKALGYDTSVPPAPPSTPALPSGFDPSKFVTQDSIRGIADGVGENLAALQDMVMEHAQLFPDKPLKVRELRKEAVAAGKTVDQYWLEKYGVIAAREKKDRDNREAWEKKLREEGAATERQRLASQYGNPELRPPMPSSNPFTRRVEGGRDKQPWERQDDASSDRVNRATQRLIEKTSGVTH